MNCFRIICPPFLLLFAVATWAERLPDLHQYTALVTSSSKNTQEYRQALVDGLAEVILRSSGDPASLQNPGVIDALGQPRRFLLQDRFEDANETVEIDGQAVPARRLVLEYSSQAIEQLLREFQLPIWPNNRRTVLVWMVVDDAQGQRVVSDSNFAEARDAVESSTQRRGLPKILPLMDLEDQIALSANQLWTLDEDAIRAASERYNPDTILIGRLSQTSRGDWRTDWNLYTEQGVEIFDSRAEHIDEAVARAVDQVSNYFFQRYAINPQLTSGNEVWLFQVGNIANFADYLGVLDYLQRLTLIRRVDLVAVRGDNLLLYLAADGSVQLLQDTLALDGKLSPRNDSADTAANNGNLSPLGSMDNPLLYAWQE